MKLTEDYLKSIIRQYSDDDESWTYEKIAVDVLDYIVGKACYDGDTAAGANAWRAWVRRERERKKTEHQHYHG